MTDIFLKFVNMGIAAGWLVLAVMLLRLVLRRAPKELTLVLWGIVALRLVLPVSIQSIFSLIPSAETISPLIGDMQEPQIHSGITVLNSAVNPVITQAFAPSPEASVNPLQVFIFASAVCWLVGAAVMMLYAVAGYWRLCHRVRTAVLFQECTVGAAHVRVYQSEYVVSPFVLGTVRPRIYMPFCLAQKNMEKEIEYVLAHEQAHIRHLDHWWKLVGFGLLALYWYNPLIWAAYILFCRDIELACDERVVRDFDAAQRADYSQALLTCSVPRRMAVVYPLAFGETGVAARVRNVLHYKKPAFWLIAAAVLACAVVAVCFLTNPKEDAEGDMQWAMRPTIMIDSSSYIDPYASASRLPYGYVYAGTLDAQQANDTGLEGREYYVSPYNQDYIYVYQECGTPVGTHEVDSTQRQWRYQPWIREGSGDGTKRLTLEEVQRLSEFGETLTWTDFMQRYDYTETGSGLYIQVYEIDEMFSLWIGGFSTDNVPMYIYLQTDTEPEDRVEIRTQDVSDFIRSHLGTAGTETNTYQVQFPAHS